MSFLKEETKKMCVDCSRHFYHIGELKHDNTDKISAAERVTNTQKCFPCPVYGNLKIKK